jgi:hypothetical protein
VKILRVEKIDSEYCINIIDTLTGERYRIVQPSLIDSLKRLLEEAYNDQLSQAIINDQRWVQEYELEKPKQQGWFKFFTKRINRRNHV